MTDPADLGNDMIQPGSVSATPDIPITDTPPVLTSPSFWVTMLPTISAIIGYFLHKQIDLSSQSAAIGLIGASIAAGALAIARSMRHKAVLEANNRAQSLALDRWATARHSVPASEVNASFRDIEFDMRQHNARLQALEDAVQEKVVPSRVAAKKTTAKTKTTARQR